MEQKQPDRISYSFGMKLSLPAKYESADFHISLSSDAQPGETQEQAFQRVKQEVERYAKQAYEQIRSSETGLNEQARITESKQSDKRDVPAPDTAESKPVEQPKPKDLKALRQQIKAAAGVLDAKKQIPLAVFKTQFLGGKKTDDLTELEVTKVLINLRESHPELGL